MNAKTVKLALLRELVEAGASSGRNQANTR